MGYYLVNDTDLTSVANTIRDVTGHTGLLSFPNGFNNRIHHFSTAILDNCGVSARLLWPISAAAGEQVPLNWQQYELICDGVAYDSRAFEKCEDFFEKLKMSGWGQCGLECLGYSWGTPPDDRHLTITIKGIDPDSGSNAAISKDVGDILFSNYNGPFAKIIKR